MLIRAFCIDLDFKLESSSFNNQNLLHIYIFRYVLMLYMYVYHAMYFMTYLNVISKAWMTDSRAKTKWTLELVTHRGDCASGGNRRIV